MPMRFRALIATLIAALVPLTLVAHADAGPAGKRDDARYRLKVISHNIAGGYLNNGVPRVLPREVPGQMAERIARVQRVALAAVEEQINTYSPKVVGLQEVCHSQYAALIEDYPDWNIEYVVMREEQPTCLVGDNPSQGQVLMSPHPMTNYTVTDLGYDEGVKNFTLACAAIEVPALVKRVRACNTHLRVNATDPTGDFKPGLVNNIADATSVANTDQTSVILGDWNAKARMPAMNPIYRLALDNTFTGPGRFFEANQTDSNLCAGLGACRADNGVDLIFFSRNTAAGGSLWGDKADAPKSDHRIYRAWAEVSGVA